MDKEKILGFDVAKYMKVYLWGDPKIKGYDPQRSEEVKQSGKQYLKDMQDIKSQDVTDDEKSEKIYKAIFDLNKRAQNLSIPIKAFKASAQLVIMDAYRKILKIKKDTIQDQLNASPLPRKLILENAMNELFETDLIDVENLINDMIKGEYLKKPDEVIYSTSLIGFAQYLNEEIKKEDETVIPESEKPIKWIGKPSQLGYIMGQLAICGYIDAPQKKDGEINYSEFARQLSKVFSVNSIENLAKELNPEKNSLENNNREKIQIPHIKSIS